MFTVSKWSLAVLTLSAHVHLLAGVLTVNVNTDSAVAGGGTFVESGAGAGAGDLRGCLNYINNQIVCLLNLLMLVQLCKLNLQEQSLQDTEKSH